MTNTHFQLSVIDAAMAPLLNDGDLITCDTATKPEQGCYMAGRVGGQFLVRQYQRTRVGGRLIHALVPLAPGWPTVTITGRRLRDHFARVVEVSWAL